MVLTDKVSEFPLTNLDHWRQSKPEYSYASGMTVTARIVIDAIFHPSKTEVLKFTTNHSTISFLHQSSKPSSWKIHFCLLEENYPLRAFLFSFCQGFYFQCTRTPIN